MLTKLGRMLLVLSPPQASYKMEKVFSPQKLSDGPKIIEKVKALSIFVPPTRTSKAIINACSTTTNIVLELEIKVSIRIQA